MVFAVQATQNQRKRKKKQLLRSCQRSKKLWNMKLKVMPIVIGALGTIPKGLVRELEKVEIGGRVEASKTTALL